MSNQSPKKPWVVIVLAIILIVVIVGSLFAANNYLNLFSEKSSTPTPTPQTTTPPNGATPTAIATPTVNPSTTPTETPESTSKTTPTPTSTNNPTATPTSNPTPTVTATPTTNPTPIVTATPTNKPTQAPTPSKPSPKILDYNSSSWMDAKFNNYFGIDVKVQNNGGPGNVRVYGEVAWPSTSTQSLTKPMTQGQIDTFRLLWTMPMGAVNMTAAIIKSGPFAVAV